MSKRTYEQNLRDAIRGHNLSYVYSSGGACLEKKTSSDFNEKLWAYMRRVAGRRHVVLYPDFNMVAQEDKDNAEELKAFIERGCKPCEPKYKHPNGNYAGNAGKRVIPKGHVPAMTDIDWQKSRFWSLDNKTNRAIRKAIKANKYDGKPLPAWMTKSPGADGLYEVDPLVEMYPHREQVIQLKSPHDTLTSLALSTPSEDKDAK